MSKTELNQKLSSVKANADYLLKTEDDIITGILSLEQGGNLNSHISDLQGHLFTLADIIGITGEADPNAKIYANTNYIADGDNRKVVVEKLDAQAKVNADNIAGNLVLITDNAAAIQAILDSIGAANGICPLDANSKIDAVYLPDVLLQYQGTWAADTNTPTLADTDIDKVNHWYRCNIAGSVDFGSGSLTFAVGDKVVNNGTIWEKWDTNDEVISVNAKTGAVVLDKTDIGLTNVTDDAQLKRIGNDFTSFTEKLTPVDGDFVLIEDSQDTFAKKKVDLANLIGSGGGGGGSFAWGLNEDISPGESLQDGMEVLDFDFESVMAISALVIVPESYKPGDQITLQNAVFFSADTQDNVLFKGRSTLFKLGEDATAVVNQHVSVNTEITLVTTNLLTAVGDIDLTDGSGEVNAIAVAPGDILKIELFRDNTNETVSSVEDARLLRYSSSIVFTE